MARRGGAVHVATTTRHYKGKTYHTHLLRRSYRENGKVKHETLGNLSHLPAHGIALVRAVLRGEVPPLATGASTTSDNAFAILRSLPHGHVAAVLGTLRKITLERLLDAPPSRMRAIVVAMIVARVLEPCSKLATTRLLRAETAASSLSLELGLEAVTDDELYAALDWLLARQARIETQLAARHLEDGTLVLYDVSSSFYTGTHCRLAAFGHNRDGKNGDPQIIYGLLCNAAGCPVAIEVFAGNTGDPATLATQIQKLRERFGLTRLVFVGDRGMLTSARIDAELRPIEGLDWITALRADAIKQLAETQVLQVELFDRTDLAEIVSPDFPDERLIACRNPYLAEERRQKREDLLQATERDLEAIAAATRRTKRPLRGKDRIGLRVGKVINHRKVAKHFQLDITETSFSYRRHEEKIAAEARLDGIYVIRTSVPAAALDTSATVHAYKDLAKVERAFRSLKTVDLRVRPIFHHLDDRVRAHVFLCMLAYYVEWHMRQALAPMLFDDEARAAAAALRTSVVAPAPRSATAKAKDARKRTADGGPVHSFRTLLKDLATLAKNRVRLAKAPARTAPEFYVLTQPTPPQRRAFELLGLALGV